ncbi:MAG TPA: DUF11 domain-containing protein [Pyrinomonadaceae bacterium]|nr:DUF11 domain-containing protein [Pyrinomonadaceae bacterium]
MATKESQALVLASEANGYIVIPQPTPLTRLNYFDGKFLRASDLKAEQDYLRQLVALSNQAGGAGVAYGFDVTLTKDVKGDQLEIGAGLAIDPSGRVLYLPRSVSIDVQQLIEKSRSDTKSFNEITIRGKGKFAECEIPPPNAPEVDSSQPRDVYRIVISAADALCGEEDVYGKLCEEACATSTDRPNAIEGILVRAEQLNLRTPLPNPKVIALTQTHFRSRVAAAYFEDERRRIASLISKSGLGQETWCLGADAAGGSGVAIGVIARGAAAFLDAWIVRRERISPEAKRYWQWRMMMRPWDVFLAQVLQFQCQLRDLFSKDDARKGDDDPCGGARSALKDAAATISELREFYVSTAQRFTLLRENREEATTFSGGISKLTTLNDKLAEVIKGLGTSVTSDRVLINGGIVELPSAGYLPVVPGEAAPINQQVRRLMGEGVDLRFCVVRPDYVAHALEEAQHMERISLLQGLEDAERKPEVDILVPNGEVLEQKQLSPGSGFEASVDLGSGLIAPVRISDVALPPEQPINLRGAARVEILPTGGGAFYLSAQRQQTRTTVGQISGPMIVDSKTVTREDSRIVGADKSAHVSGFGAAAADSKATVNTDTVGDFLSVATQSPPRLGLWISLRCDPNVFGLRRGDSANIDAHAILASGAERTPLLEVELHGIIRITQPTVTSGTTQKVTGHVENARLSFRGTVLGNAQTISNGLVDFDVVAELRNKSAITVRIDGQKDFIFTADWGQEPLQVSAEFAGLLLKGNTRTGGKTFASANLKEDADVLSDQDKRHVQAVAALELIAKILNDPDFADAKRRLLFPPPPKPVEELLVRGTMDWVLFHRRRTRRCEPDVVPAPVPLPPRRYIFWMLVAANAEAVRTVAADLAAGTPLNRELVFMKRVDIVEFEPGLATLISEPDDVVEDWKLTDPGPRIAHAAIASATANDGDAVANSRLGRLEKTVAGVSSATNATSQVLATVHPELAVENTDGFVAFITLRETRPVCHKVSTSRDPREFERVLKVIAEGNLDDITGISELGLLGTAEFKGGTAEVLTPDSASDPKTWRQLGDTAEAMIVVTSNQDDDAVPMAQAKLILDRVGSRIEARSVKTPGKLPTTRIPCPAFSVVLVQEAEQTVACRLDARTIIFVATPGSPSTEQLTINNDSKTDFKVTLTTTTARFAVTSPKTPSVTVAAGKSIKVAIQYSPAAGGTSGEDKDTLSIITEPTAGLCPTVALVGQPKPAPQPADLSITKSANASTVTSGSTITYTITLRNGASVAATDVNVTDQLPGKEAFLSARVVTGAGWGDPVAPPKETIGGTVVFSKASMGANETATFEIVIRAGGIGPVINNVRAQAKNDPNLSQTSVTVNVVQASVTRRALLIFSNLFDGTRVPDGTTSTEFTFVNELPSGTTLESTLKGANIRGTDARVTLATTGTLDSGAAKRATAVGDAVKKVGAVSSLSPNSQQLSAADRAWLVRNKIDITNIDDVIFVDRVIPG